MSIETKPLDGPTPMTDAAFAKHCESPALCIDELLRCSSNLERIAAEAVGALKLIMHARRNPDIALTDMSRAGMRELAGEALSRIKAAGYVQEKPKCSCQEFANPTCPVHR